MKLTTSINFEKSKGMNKATTLKFMIQQAASQCNTQSITKNLLDSDRSHGGSHLNLKAPKKKIKQFANNDKQNMFENKMDSKSSVKNLVKSLKNIHANQTIQNNSQRGLQSTISCKNVAMIQSVDYRPRIQSTNNLLKNISLKNLYKNKPQTQRKKQMQLSIERFNLGKKIGKGRFGSVYIAQDSVTKFTLALKIISIKQVKEANMQDQLVSQIKLQMFMKHPNILKMYGFFTDKRNIYLMLQLAEDCLFSKITQQNGLTEKQAAYHTKQVLQAMKYMHSQSIIHRDIKPQNILLINGVAKIGDFGWSVYSPLYKRQTFCGTLDYVPPQIVEGQFYDEKADIWSLGVLIYELNLGQAPFQTSGGDQDETFNKIRNNELRIPDKLSPELKKLISTILVRNPKLRLQLKQIDKSQWLQIHEKEGRFISSQIWNFWNSK